MKKKYLLGSLILSAAFGLVACGDSSSTPTAKDIDDYEEYADNAQKQVELSQKLYSAQLEASELLNEECSTDGKKKTITVDGKDFEAVCNDGYWESEEVEEYLEDLENQLAKLQEETYKSLINGGGCDFKMSDNKWSYTISMSDLIVYTHTLEIDGEDVTITDVETTVNPGKTAGVDACDYIDDDWAEEKYGSSITSKSRAYCKGDKIIYEDVEIRKDEITDEASRKSAFNEFMEQCQTDNGNFNWEPESSDDEDIEDQSSSSTKKDDKSSSSTKDDEEDESSSSTKKENSEPSCNFNVDDDEWVIDMDGVKMIYTIDGDKVIMSADITTDMGSEEACKMMLDVYEGTCDGSVLKASEKMDEISLSDEDLTRQDLYDQISTNCND